MNIRILSLSLTLLVLLGPDALACRRHNIVIITATPTQEAATNGDTDKLRAEGYTFSHCYFQPDAAISSSRFTRHRYTVINLTQPEAADVIRTMTDKKRLLIAVQTHPDDLGDLVSALRSAGLYDKAYLLYTAPGGDTPYEESWHIPLIIKLPSSKHSTLPPGSLIADPVTSDDLAPTIARMAGIKENVTGQGQSMLPLIRRKAKAWRHFVFFDSPRYHAITDGRLKYLLHADGTEEFYNLLVDPFETQNRAHIKSIALTEMRRSLTRHHGRP